MKTTENRSEECSVKKNVFNVDRQFMLSIPFVKIHPAIYQEFQVGSGLLFVFHFELLLQYLTDHILPTVLLSSESTEVFLSAVSSLLTIKK